MSTDILVMSTTSHTFFGKGARIWMEEPDVVVGAKGASAAVVEGETGRGSLFAAETGERPRRGGDIDNSLCAEGGERGGERGDSALGVDGERDGEWRGDEFVSRVGEVVEEENGDGGFGAGPFV